MHRTLLAYLALAGFAIGCSTAAAPTFVDGDDCADVSHEPLRRTEATLHFDSGKQVDVDAEVASTTDEHLQGLMCRSEVPPGTGMLFLFDSERIGQFWMFNTHVDLDIAYISADGTIADLKRMTSCRRDGETRDEWSQRCFGESVSYAPSRGYTATLELPADWLASVGENGGALTRVTWN